MSTSKSEHLKLVFVIGTVTTILGGITAAHATIVTRKAEISGGKLVVTGSVSRNAREVILDGKFTVAVINRKFRFSLNYLPKTCIVHLASTGSTGDIADAIIGNCGPEGPAGLAGPTGIVSIKGWHGLISAIPAGAVNWTFAGSTAQVTTVAGQRLTASGSAFLGLHKGEIQNFDLDMCYQSKDGGNITPFNTEYYMTAQITTTRNVFAISGTTTPAAGTWNVGICVRNPSGSQAISNNDNSVGWVMVSN